MGFLRNTHITTYNIQNCGMQHGPRYEYHDASCFCMWMEEMRGMSPYETLDSETAHDELP